MSVDATAGKSEVVEEVFSGELTGVEIEQVGTTSDGAIAEPWDPEKIRVSTKSFSLRNVLDMIDADDLDLAPDFQRNRVWKPRQKSRLIESLLLQIPLPAFYFAEDADGLLRVVDGLQRLSTIHSFVRRDDFRLADLEYLANEEGAAFGDLPPSLQRRLNNAQIVVHVIDPTTPTDVKYDIFKRINTGGEPLNSMEIRHCMSRPRSRAFLKRCASAPAFDAATGGALWQHVRMHDRESVLRFLAFRMLGEIDRYESVGSLERLLDTAVADLDNETLISDADLEALFADFVGAMEKCHALFEENTFRKWSEFSYKRSPINRALLESWAVSVADVPSSYLAEHRDRIVHGARAAMTRDYTYIDSISSSTGDPRRVQTRFDVASNLIGYAQ